MVKIRVMVVGENDDIKFEIKNKLINDDIAFLGFSKTGEGALEKILSMTPNIVLIVYEDNESIEMAQRIYLSLPGCAVILLCENIDFSIINVAMNAGVRRVISVNSSQEELIDSIKSGFDMEFSRLKSSGNKILTNQSKVIAIFGPKGGIGKTTISSNLAVALAKKGKKVAVIDLNLQFGDLNLFFDIQPKDTIVELVQEYQNFDIDTIKSYMMLHYSGVSILCAPKSPELAEFVTGEHAQKIIDTIRPFYDYVIIDTTPYFTDSAIISVESADLVLMIVALDISILRNARISLEVFESLQQKDKISLVVNRNAPSLISVKDTQNILEMPVKYKISSDYKTAVSSLNKGVPIVLEAPRTAIGRELLALGDWVINHFEKN